MYKKSFYIKNPVWNNSFSYKERKNKKLFVSSLKEIDNFDDIKLWKEIKTDKKIIFFYKC